MPPVTAAAAPVAQVMRKVIDERRPLAFVIDLSQAHYRGGDGICGLVVAHRVPLAIVAPAGDRERIHRTLQITELLQALGGRLFAGLHPPATACACANPNPRRSAAAGEAQVVSQTREFLKPTELTDGNVSSSECRGHAKTSNDS